MKYLSITILIAATSLFQSCAPHISSYLPDPTIQLSRQYKKIAIISVGSASQSVTTSNIFEGKISQTNVMDGNSQIQMAVDSFAFECEKLGFQVVLQSEAPDLLLELNIGSIRFDSFAGWIADQGIVRLRDANSKRIVAQFKAKSSFLTPTIENIISKLMTEIKNTY